MSDGLQNQITTNKKKYVSWSEAIRNSRQEESKRSRKEWLKSNKTNRIKARKMNNDNRDTQQRERDLQRERDAWETMKAKYMYHILRSPDENSTSQFLAICEKDPESASCTRMVFAGCDILEYSDIRRGLDQFRSLEPGGEGDPDAKPDQKAEIVWSEQFQHSDPLKLILCQLLKRPLIQEAWGAPIFAPLFKEVTSEDSADRQVLASTNQLVHETQLLPLRSRYAVWHYAMHTNPRDPVSAMRELGERFRLDNFIYVPQQGEDRPRQQVEDRPPQQVEDRLRQEEEGGGAPGGLPSPSSDRGGQAHEESSTDPDSPTAGSHSTSGNYMSDS